MIKRVPKQRQHDTTDCGVACLASIARFHGTRVSVARLRQSAQTDQTGTTLRGLTRAAQQVGYSAKAVRAAKEALARAPMPTIAHVSLRNGGQHFVVVERADDAKVWTMDPADGKHYTIKRAEFDAQWTGALLLLTPSAGMQAIPTLTSRAARVWALARPHRSALVQSLVGSLVYTLLGISVSIYVQQIVDTVLADGRAGPLRVMTLAMVGIMVAQTVIGALRSLLMVHVGQHIDAALILGYYNHLLELPLSFFDRMRVGELTSRVTDAVKIRAFVGDVVVEGMASVMIITASSAMMFSYDWRLALWTLGMLPLYAALYAIGARMNKSQQRQLMERSAALESHMVESLSAIGTVKRFNVESQMALETEAKFVRLFRTAAHSARTTVWTGNSGMLLSRLGTIGLLYIGTTRALSQQMSAGQVMSCYALLGFLTGPALALVGFSRAVAEARVAGERLFEIMELEPEPRLAPIPLANGSGGDVCFEGVTFRYSGRSAALSDVSFTCPAGRITAIVGASGSGKSTLAALVQRLYPLEQGRIVIGAHDIAHVDASSLRRHVCVVPQNIDLFATTVIENLALGDSSPDVGRLAELCDQAGIREVIERMPQGWFTRVGERGVTLSGGEKQRMAMVRALYRNPSVLILDEATSALDPANERRLLDVIRQTSEAGTTVIVIAHRLTTVAEAHRVVVMDAGRVVEEGTPESLRLRGGFFAKMSSVA